MRAPSLAVLGLDAAPPGFLERAASSLGLPRLSSFLGKARGFIHRAVPPSTWPSWTTMMTGVHWGWHGITGFFLVDRRGRSARLANAMDLEYPRIHEVLAWHGVRSMVVNPVPDHPLIPVKGSRIVSWFMFTGQPLSHPEGLASRYLEGRVKRRISGCHDADLLLDELVGVRDLLEGEAGEEPLLWVTLRLPDYLFHKCPRAIQEPRVAERLFRAIDGMLGVLLDRYDSVVVVSDHGFATYRAQVSVNDVLASAGLARAGGGLREESRAAGGAGRGTVYLRVPRGLYKLIHKLRLAGPARALLAAAGRLVGAKIDVSVSADVDVLASKAALLYDIDHGVVAFDPEALGEALRALRRAEGVLLAVETGRVRGPYATRSHDILVMPDYFKGYMLSDRKLKGLPVIRTPYHGHHPDGVLYVSGPLAESPLLPRHGGIVDNTILANMIYCAFRAPLPAQSPYARAAGRCGVGVRDYAPRWRAAMALRRRLVRGGGRPAGRGRGL